MKIPIRKTLIVIIKYNLYSLHSLICNIQEEWHNRTIKYYNQKKTSEQ